ncbi:hypothetical protein SLA2020_193170 [Shorea laevis]
MHLFVFPIHELPQVWLASLPCYRYKSPVSSTTSMASSGLDYPSWLDSSRLEASLCLRLCKVFATSFASSSLDSTMWLTSPAWLKSAPAKMMALSMSHRGHSLAQCGPPHKKQSHFTLGHSLLPSPAFSMPSHGLEVLWLILPTVARKRPLTLFHGLAHVSNERVESTLELTFKWLDSATPILSLFHLEVKSVELLMDVPHGQLSHS